MPDHEETLSFGRPGPSLQPRAFPSSIPAFFKSISAVLLCGFLAVAGHAQKAQPNSVTVVEPGAPGTPSRKLPPSTSPVVPQKSQADIEFMQGMIMHHSQAVEMTALIPSHTVNKELRSLGARISSSQSDEIKFM